MELSDKLIAAGIQCLANDLLNKFPLPLVAEGLDLNARDVQRLADRLTHAIWAKEAAIEAEIQAAFGGE